MVKPFSFAEPLAHIWALLRREKTVKLSKLKVGDLVLDPASRDVYRRDKEIYLTPKEYRFYTRIKCCGCYSLQCKKKGGLWI
jgi:DNA-binding response OmpR family regulator